MYHQSDQSESENNGKNGAKTARSSTTDLVVDAKGQTSDLWMSFDVKHDMEGCVDTVLGISCSALGRFRGRLVMKSGGRVPGFGQISGVGITDHRHLAREESR